MNAPSPEDLARADLYALLARLFYAPPDGALLDSLARPAPAGADVEGTAMRQAWRALAAAAAAADPATVTEEYESSFIGIGASEVTLYTTAYTMRGALDNPLVALRDFLAALGLARKEAVSEPEDHIAALCEVMRHLILRDDVAAQRTLFEEHLWPGAALLCDAVTAHERARFYGPVARLAKTFFEIEHTAFDMD